ncbi:hypothetical protein MUK42_07379 [Musa troglodytarum]|uniref:Uncharacterized protein n=1 Tax=Musa troglodytarum TaxID=320322 RepID=A0A9E7H6L3_9LILI|nr:hypothetical protein MUK42_07379 [Musa troglodytarum]
MVLSHCIYVLFQVAAMERTELMAEAKARFLVVLMLLVSLHAHVSMSTEARPLASDKEHRYVEVLQSLGIRCRCCDGVGGECRSTWASHCDKLECHPSKFL